MCLLESHAVLQHTVLLASGHLYALSSTWSTFPCSELLHILQSPKPKSLLSSACPLLDRALTPPILLCSHRGSPLSPLCSSCKELWDQLFCLLPQLDQDSQVLLLKMQDLPLKLLVLGTAS